jgi:hypothetical protein
LVVVLFRTLASRENKPFNRKKKKISGVNHAQRRKELAMS